MGHRGANGARSEPNGGSMARPAVFIHGLWLHATSWRPWLDLFAQRGYDPVAPGWPHEPATVEEARAQPEAAPANFVSHSPAAVDTRNARRGPLLLVSGGKDHTVPDSVTRSTFKQYRHSSAVTELKQFPDRGHSLIIDNGWREVADAA